jgi:transcriptional regulator with GAF, ATPase, and Fis domain
MKKLQARLNALTASNTPDLVVLLQGETGTGKSTIARKLHEAGVRKKAPFVTVNAASIPDTLFESLMFGFVKGAFTGATSAQAGWLEMAKGGTLFLDEVGEMPLAHQVRLLETFGGARRFRRLGAVEEQTLDVHLFCATSRDLKQEVAAGRFRPELLRRIQVNTCRIPPLRERGHEDINLLACHLVTDYLRMQGLHKPDAPHIRLEDFLSRQARDYLYHYEWPWNVGELENLFRNEGIRSKLRLRGKEKVELDEVLEALDLEKGERWIELSRDTSGLPPLHLNYRGITEWTERAKGEHMSRVFALSSESISETARRMDCSRDVVYKYLEIAKSPPPTEHPPGLRNDVALEAESPPETSAPSPDASSTGPQPARPVRRRSR